MKLVSNTLVIASWVAGRNSTRYSSISEGFVRHAYDSDTEVYTFRDRKGSLYRGAPRSEYGVLTPISDKDPLSATRPGAFESDQPQKQRPQRPSVKPGSAPMTFHDILPSNCITTPSSSVDNPLSTSPVSTSPASPTSPRTSARVKFMEAARKTALPKMQGVVYNLRRSKTSAGHTTTGTEDTEHLLRRGSSTVSRSTSQATTHSAVSVETRMSVNSRV